MDTKRLLMAIVLSFAVLFGYQLLFNKKAPQTQPEVQPPISTVAGPETAAIPPGPTPAKTGETQPQAAPAKAAAASGEIRKRVSTSLFDAVWTNKGGVLLSWTLTRHLGDKNQPVELVPKASETLGIRPFALLEETGSALPIMDLPALRESPLNASLYETSAGDLVLRDGQRGELRFRFSDGQGLEAEKVFTFTGGAYDFGVEIRVLRGGRKVEPRVLWGPGLNNPTEEELKKSFGTGGGMTALAGDNLIRVEDRRYKPEQSVVPYIDWAAYDDNYFCALFFPAAKPASAAFIRADVETTPYFFLAVGNPGRAFVGPKDFDLLTALGHKAKKIVRFGFFGFFSEILFSTIKVIHKAVPNWGWSIVILTLIIKIIFFPLTYSSTKSMSKMAELQPRIKALRNKYKKSKTDIQERRRMNEEMMQLYKEHGVNPAGGCLPLLIQIPFFFGIFKMLQSAIEFRRSPWILWINDLSVRDPYYVTPILMGVTQFITQKMTPSSADPTQAKMMLLMPVIMTVFFLNFQSGLVLYWLTSNVLQIGQQYLMNRMMQRKKSESHGKPGKK